jgi:hypothetical protein
MDGREGTFNGSDSISPIGNSTSCSNIWPIKFRVASFQYMSPSLHPSDPNPKPCPYPYPDPTLTHPDPNSNPNLTPYP